MSHSTLTLVLSGVTLNALAQLALKAATNRIGYLRLDPAELGVAALSLLSQPPFWLGLACYVSSVAIWLVALSRVEVSLAYPFLSLGYVLNALAAWYLFGEVVTSQRAGAIAVIVLGVYLLGRT